MHFASYSQVSTKNITLIRCLASLHPNPLSSIIPQHKVITCYAFWSCFLDAYACLLVSCSFGVRSYVIMKLVPLRYTLLISKMIDLLHSSRIVQTMVTQNVPYNLFLLTLYAACMITSRISKQSSKKFWMNLKFGCTTYISFSVEMSYFRVFEIFASF